MLDGNEDWAHRHVILILSEYSGRDPSDITPSDRLADLMVDSLDVVELVMRLEDEFGIDFPDDDIGCIETVQDLIELVRRRRP